jgi:hypothetical protein
MILIWLEWAGDKNNLLDRDEGFIRKPVGL